MEVWGTGEATAERWYRDGCRSLEDVQGRTDLSIQQVGLTLEVTKAIGGKGADVFTVIQCKCMCLIHIAGSDV